MKFYKDDNNNYQIEKDDYLLLIKKQIHYYSKLNQNLFDKSTNIEILKELIKDMNYELENSSFPEREVYISEKNYMERNKRAVIFYQLYVSYGITLMKSYIDYFKRNPGQFFNIEDDNQNIMKLDRRIDEIENDFRKHLEQNLNSNEHPVYGTTMLTISLVERIFFDNLVNLVFKDLIQELNGKFIPSEEKKVVWNAGIKVYLMGEAPLAFEDIDDFKKDLVDIFCENSALLNLNSGARRDLEQLVADVPPTLNSLINNSFTEKYVDKTILNFFKKLFAFEELNLRNDIMHCNTDKLYEPSDYPVTAIVFHILVLILQHKIFI